MHVYLNSYGKRNVRSKLCKLSIYDGIFLLYIVQSLKSIQSDLLLVTSPQCAIIDANGALKAVKQWS
jgi:hypothetical protein